MNKRGGKREGAGRKHSPVTSVVRVSDDILFLVNAIKANEFTKDELVSLACDFKFRSKSEIMEIFKNN